MDKPPLISVIIPCYRQAHLLPQAVDSVRAQGMDDWEIVIVDDGSPDDTQSVAQGLIAIDPRVRLLTKTNGGLSSARNAGVATARGNYLQFLDADDLLEPEKFSRDIHAVAASDGVALVINDFCYLDAQGRRYTNEYCQPRFAGQDYELELAIRWESDLSIPVHAFLFDARLFREASIRFDERLPNHEDWAAWMRIFALHPVVFQNTYTAAVYRKTAAGMTGNRQAMCDGFLQAIDDLLALQSVRPELRRALIAKRILTLHQYGRGWRAAALKVLRANMVANLVPWPVQLRLYRWFQADVQAHAVAVKRRFLAA